MKLLVFSITFVFFVLIGGCESKAIFVILGVKNIEAFGKEPIFKYVEENHERCERSIPLENRVNSECRCVNFNNHSIFACVRRNSFYTLSRYRKVSVELGELSDKLNDEEKERLDLQKKLTLNLKKLVDKESSGEGFEVITVPNEVAKSLESI